MSRSSTKVLVMAVLAMTLVVLSLGVLVVAVRLRGSEAAPPPATPEAALQELRAAVEEHPEDPAAWTALGLKAVEAGRTSEALRAFERALDLDERNWVAAFQLGVLQRGEDPARAAELLERAAKLAPRLSKAGPLVALGELRLEQGDAEAARDAFQRAIADVPYLLDAHLGLARALETLGDERGALKAYERAARFDPTNPEIRAAIERLRGET